MDVTNSRNMNNKRYTKGLFAALLLLSVQAQPVLQAAQIGHKCPKDSFLKTQVSSVGGLVDELNSNPSVRNRYAKLYHMPSYKIAAYMKKNLQIVHLTHAYYHSVYCVTPSGVIFTADERLKAGEKVFALRNGRPVLRWACGNPFTRVLPTAPQSKMSSTVVFTGPKPHVAVASNVVVPTEKVAAYISPPVDAPVVGGPTDIVIPAVGTIVSHVPLTPFIAALPVLFVGTHSGSGSSTTGTTGTTGTTSTTGTPGTTGTTGTTSTTGTPGTTGTTGTTSTTGTPGTTGTTGTTSTTGTPGTTSTTGTTGTTAGVTPEPGQLTTWSLAGLFLAVGAAVGRRRKKNDPSKA